LIDLRALTSDGAGGEGRPLFRPPVAVLWQEPLYVFIDPSFHFFEAVNVGDPSDLYGPEVARCRGERANCAKRYLVAAIVNRLSLAETGQAMSTETDAVLGRFQAALSNRLEEYERRRDLYPTLWSFYPRLFGVFRELAFPGEPAVALRLPAGKARKTTDFFSEKFRTAAAVRAP